MAAVIAVLLAVAGWIVNQALARRAIRRNMRIDYLLSAYRRLEGASNRPMSVAHEGELEIAVSDIQLLGSPRQVEMASEFARQFATDRRADCEPLLDDLRTSLRSELLLEPVPLRRVVLRIDRHTAERSGPSVTVGSWAVWREQEERVVTSLRAVGALDASESPAPAEPSEATPFAREMLTLAEHTSPIAAVTACHQRLTEQLRGVLEVAGMADQPFLSATELAHAARGGGLISAASLTGVEGLGVMHTLALLDDGARNLDFAKAREYAALTEALLFALRFPPAT